MRGLRIVLVTIGIVFALAALTGFIGDRIATAREKEKYPPKGKLVDIGGYRIHLYCVGSGSPTVLLDAGFFDSLEQWKLVQPQVAQKTRVCSYDRAGEGWSDSSPYPQTSTQIASEFHAALVAAGEHGPYIAVGHSIAGLYARMFVTQYRPEVAGLLLDDSVHPDECLEFPPQCAGHPLIFGMVRLASPLGLTRVLPFCHQSGARPDCAKYVGAVLRGFDATRTSHLQVKQTNSYGNLPLVVLAHDPKTGLDKKRDDVREAAWTKWQVELSRLSANSSLIVVPGVGHEIQLEKPDVVIDAIDRLLEESRPKPQTGQIVSDNAYP